ncbi:hypothetical protein P3X46_003216 [Hevea brasiliensis]|uniref:DUF538 domain-containing protein n=1 Tax=Hevea brasiliensis TaxID=3981 RepID=A0ABQ9N6E1_HEVBR|nr:uncharacterized protein LOC110635949 [Hevea brasiliensis]KAJ9187799.1 hypothetical protein P3X46_003216 [Hevea brasiliensis]
MGLLPLPKSLPLMALLWAILFTLMTSSTTPFASGDDDDGKLSAYEVLATYDFPRGLLPVGVAGYELNRETGEFSAYLNGTCKYRIESYTLEYKSTITGVISKGRLRKLKGVRVYVVLLWLNIVEVSRDGDDLDFSVGIASASFPVDNFEESPQCGCGFDCDKLKDGLVSSS